MLTNLLIGYLIATVFSKNSYDSVDIVEEPAAEPISTHFGDGWVPISINQVIKTISEEIDSKVKLTTPIVPSSKRVPKVLKWFDNPYFIQVSSVVEF